MNTVEVLMLLQTLILFGTGVVLVWYTLETRRMRTGASAQLDLMHKSFVLAAKRERQAAEPIFIWGGGLATGSTVEWHFINEGGPISHLTATMQTEGVRAAVAPDQWLGTSREGVIVFDGNVMGEIRFTIGFQTRLGGVFGFFFVASRGTKPVYTGSGEVC